MGFPNQFFNDSWVVGIWRAGHGGNNVGLGRRAWALARAVPGALGSQVTAANVSTLRGGADRIGCSLERSAKCRASCAGGLLSAAPFCFLLRLGRGAAGGKTSHTV